MGAGWQRWWHDADAKIQSEADELDRVRLRETIGNCTITHYWDGRVTYSWEQQVISIGVPRFIGYDPRTGRCYEIPQPSPDDVLAAHKRG